MVRYLSFPYSTCVPVYGNAEANMEIDSIKDIAKGDSCRTYRFTMENHWGTHVDAPAHFFLHGRRIAEYDPAYFLFERVQVVEISAEPGQLLRSEDFPCTVSPDTELLLIKTGWSRYRGQALYSKENPGLHPDLGMWLRQNFTNLRAVGMDFVSISSYVNRDMGREAHRAFLNPEGQGTPLLLIEDMDLSTDLTGLIRVWLAPLMAAELDSAPCTILGFFHELSED